MKRLLLGLFICLTIVGCGEKDVIKPPQKLVFDYENILQSKTSVKYQSNIHLKIQDGKIPDIEEIKQIFEEVKKDNGGFKNYFMNFHIDDKISLFRLSQLGNEEVKISNSWNSLIFNTDIKINERFNKISGFIKYSDVYLEIGESIEQVNSRLGKSIFNDENRIFYIVFNKMGEFITEISILPVDDKVKEIDFSFGEILEEKEKEKIEKYFFGNKTVEAKRFDNRNGINIKLKDVGSEFDTAKRRRGYTGPFITTLETPKSTEIIVYGEEYGFETRIYIKKEKVYKIEVIQTKEKSEETYREFQEQIAIACSFATNGSLGLKTYDVIKDAGVSYDKFIDDKKYIGEFEGGYLRYSYINNGDFNVFQIKNIN